MLRHGTNPGGIGLAGRSAVMNKTIGRTNDDIQRVLSSLLRDVKDPRVKQGMITVTGVDTTTDLTRAKVYLSVFNLEDEKRLQKGLKSAAGFMRSELARILGLRNTPELVFEIDKSIEHGSRINTILNELDIPHPQESEDMPDDDSR